MQQRATIFAACLVLSGWLSFVASAPARAEVHTGPIPAWVTERSLSREESPPEATRLGGHLLLLDIQQDRTRAAWHLRQAVRVVDARGVGSYSDITTDYDPSYASLLFHHVRILRRDEVIDKLADHEIRTFQRETGLESGVYNGRTTAVINLRDVRVGDIVDFAYTIEGGNPLLEDHVTFGAFQQMSTPVRDLHLRVVVPAAADLVQHLRNGAEALTERHTGGVREFSWHGRDLPGLILDQNAPLGWEPQPEVALTSFADWPAVADWGRPLYEMTDADRAAIALVAADILVGATQADRILAAIRFVQDQVRYLGLADGLWAFQPRRPSQCLGQRFGDCKDKSLLLIALLEHLGVPAEPVLVSTWYRHRVVEQATSPLAFDHCVVGFRHAGRQYYVDPTLDHQGGDLDGMVFPDYGLGLPLGADRRGLVELPRPEVPRLEISEDYTVLEVGEGDVLFTVETRYHGREADRRRSNYAGISLDQISQQFLQYYSAIHPGIELAARVAVVDTARAGDNVFVVKESYVIHEAWQENDQHQQVIEFYPLELAGYLYLDGSPARSAPYACGDVVDLRFTSRIVMPEDWSIAIEPTTIQGEGFEFTSQPHGEGPLIELYYRYHRWLDEIPAADTPAFLAAQDRILEALGFHVYYADPDLAAPGVEVEPVAVMLALLTLLISVAAAWTVARRHDPQPRVLVSSPRPFGGWLLLPLVGFLVRPLLLLGGWDDLQTLFMRDTWLAAERGLLDVAPTAWSAVIIGELVGNTILFVFSILTAWLMINRRTSTPPVAMVMLVFSALFLSIDHVAALRVMGSELFDESPSDVVGAWIAVLVWVPYFARSRRVQETFVFRADGRPTLAVQDQVLA